MSLHPATPMTDLAASWISGPPPTRLSIPNMVGIYEGSREEGFVVVATVAAAAVARGGSVCGSAVQGGSGLGFGWMYLSIWMGVLQSMVAEEMRGVLLLGEAEDMRA